LPRYAFYGVLVLLALLGTVTVDAGEMKSPSPVLQDQDFKHYIDGFNRGDLEHYRQHISNAEAWDFLRQNIPLLECPDKDIERTYYFRWWTFRKHIKETPDGFVITEFLPPVGWAAKHNTINCAAGHHFYEGRWLHEPVYLNDYALFWFRRGGAPRNYSFWAADAFYARYLVGGDLNLLRELLPDLIENYKEWEKNRLEPDGLFWQIDDRDGMEVSVGGSGKRATINSYMYGEAMAIARLSALVGRQDIEGQFRAKAETLKSLVQSRLWDPEAQFFKTLPRDDDTLVDVRELHGYTPWYFNLPDPGYEVAWKELFDPLGFSAPFGPTTAEQRHPGFRLSYEGHECQWNGPSWPYATSMTLTALANLLNNYPQNAVSKTDYYNLLKAYTGSHQLTSEDGQVVPWIDENLHPYTGDWISRTRLKTWKDGTWDPGKGGVERGKDYNHSTFCNLVISGLIGLRPRADDIVEVNPLVPPEAWDWFCLDNVLYHGHTLTILWDKTGEKYGRGKGLRVLADGREVAGAESLRRVEGTLASSTTRTAAGWRKARENPLLGGDLGTCFDVTLLQEYDTYRMWYSAGEQYEPNAIGYATSTNGLRWIKHKANPVFTADSSSRWEQHKVTASQVIVVGDWHLMVYIGFHNEHFAQIGLARSRDGVLGWERHSANPIIFPTRDAWDGDACYKPFVIFDEKQNRWLLWYNGRKGNLEQIGLAVHPGTDLGFQNTLAEAAAHASIRNDDGCGESCALHWQPFGVDLGVRPLEFDRVVAGSAALVKAKSALSYPRPRQTVVLHLRQSHLRHSLFFERQRTDSPSRTDLTAVVATGFTSRPVGHHLRCPQSVESPFKAHRLQHGVGTRLEAFPTANT
jgi:hypothetical protein